MLKDMEMLLMVHVLMLVDGTILLDPIIKRLLVNIMNLTRIMYIHLLLVTELAIIIDPMGLLSSGMELLK